MTLEVSLEKFSNDKNILRINLPRRPGIGREKLDLRRYYAFKIRSEHFGNRFLMGPAVKEAISPESECEVTRVIGWYKYESENLMGYTDPKMESAMDDGPLTMLAVKTSENQAIQILKDYQLN